MANDTHEEDLIVGTPHVNVDGGVAEMVSPWRRLQVCKRFLLAMMLLPLTLLAVLPDLVPCAPSGWSAPLVLTTSASSTTANSVFRNTDYLYVNIAVACYDASVTTPFSCALYVDGVLKKTWDTDRLDDGCYTSSLDSTACPVGLLSAGFHTFTLIADSGYVISESNEDNNTYSTTIMVSESGPANDNFDNAAAITGLSGATTGSNVNATNQSGEPLLDVFPSATTTVWWKWTAPKTGTVTFSTEGSLFDTLMGIYTGSSLSSLALVHSDDDGGENRASVCTFSCTSGSTYYICVGGYNGSSGSVSLQWNIAATVYYTICLNKNDGSGGYVGQDCAVGREDVLPWPGSELGWTRSGYTFSGWSIAPKSAIPTYANHETVTDIAAPDHTINLYAIWKPNSDYTYKVRFHAMDGTGRTYDQTFKKSESKCLAYLESGIGWSRPGYIFCGWSDVGSSRVCKYNNGTKVYDLSLTPNGVVDLYAVWLSTSSHRIRYTRNIPGYDEVTREHVFWKGTSDTLAWVESQLNWNYKGYTFAGWSRSQGATRPEFTNGQRVQDLAGSGKTLTLYAVWRKNNP